MLPHGMNEDGRMQRYVIAAARRSLSTAVTAAKVARSARYHRAHRLQATAILANIARDTGRSLPASDRKLCDDYARDVLGHRHYAPWLYVYSLFSGNFREGWIPDNYYGAVVVPRLKGAYGAVSSLKPLNTAILGRQGFPDIASHINGLYYDCAGGG